MRNSHTQLINNIFTHRSRRTSNSDNTQIVSVYLPKKLYVGTCTQTQ